MSSPSAPLIALVLCGGGGLRLWPVSSDARPKQFLKLFGDETLFQTTFSRLDAAGVDETVILTNVALEALAREDLAELGATGARYVLEPARRDSGPAIAAGVAAIRQSHGEDAIVLVVASDHLIPDVEAFAKTVAKGRALAAQDYLVTFGIKPTFPAIEYGYIQRGPAVSGLEDAYRVENFHEKPGIDRASAYLADPSFAWNAGIFMFRAGFFAQEAHTHMPQIWEAASQAVQNGQTSGDRLLLETAAFSSAERLSIDFALMERSQRVGMVPADFLWSDIGSWNAVQEASPHNSAGNAIRGQVQTRDCAHSLIFAQDMPIYSIGLENFVVIASSRGVFIAPRGRTQEIKAMLDTATPL